jgi:hypothetical protein
VAPKEMPTLERERRAAQEVAGDGRRRERKVNA